MLGNLWFYRGIPGKSEYYYVKSKELGQILYSTYWSKVQRERYMNFQIMVNEFSDKQITFGFDETSTFINAKLLLTLCNYYCILNILLLYYVIVLQKQSLEEVYNYLRIAEKIIKDISNKKCYKSLNCELYLLVASFYTSIYPKNYGECEKYLNKAEKYKRTIKDNQKLVIQRCMLYLYKSQDDKSLDKLWSSNSPTISKSSLLLYIFILIYYYYLENVMKKLFSYYLQITRLYLHIIIKR